MDLKQNIIGEIGEHLVVAELLRSNVGSICLPVNKTQKGWDIIVVTEKNRHIRIQVKTTFLDNNSTNNSFTVEENYDFLVIVVFKLSDDETEFFCLKKETVEKIKGSGKKIAISKKKNGRKSVRDDIKEYQVKEDWNKKLGIK